MPDSTKPSTGPLIMESVVQLQDDVKAIRAALDTHTGAAARRDVLLTKQLDIIRTNGRYYGEELVKAYRRLEQAVRRLESKLDQLDMAEQVERAEHETPV